MDRNDVITHGGAIGIIVATSRMLIRVAGRSEDGLLLRAAKNSAVGAVAGATLGSSLGYAGSTWEGKSEQLEGTAVFAAGGAYFGGVIGFVTTLVTAAVRR